MNPQTPSKNLKNNTMTSTADYDIIIIGGGMVGCATALAFTQYGYKVKVMEKSLENHPVGAAIGLFPNGMSALKAISQNVYDKVVDNSIHIKKMKFLNLKSQVNREINTFTDNSTITPLYLVWYRFQQFLNDELPPDTVSIGMQFVSYTIDDETGLVNVTVIDRSNKSHHTHSCKILIGCDGLYSTFRQFTFGESHKNFHGKVMFRACFDNSLIQDQAPRGTAVNYAGDEEGKLFTFRETSPDIGTVTAMVNDYKSKSDLPKDIEDRKQRFKDVFSNYPSEVIKLIDAIPASALYVDRVETVDVLPEWSKGSVLVLGDACHAMTPGMGQGINVSLEDAITLAKVVYTDLRDLKYASMDDISDSLTKFWMMRIERVKKIHKASEMTSKVIMKSNQPNDAKGTTPISKSNQQQFSSEERKAFFDMVYSWKPIQSIPTFSQGILNNNKRLYDDLGNNCEEKGESKKSDYMPISESKKGTESYVSESKKVQGEYISESKKEHK